MGAGVPPRLPLEPTAAAIDDLRALTDLVAARHGADQTTHEAAATFETLLHPLGAATAERSRSWLVGEAERLGALQRQRATLEADRNELNHTINTRLRERPSARRLGEEGRSDVDFGVEAEQLEAELTLVDEARDERNRERGELDTRLQELKASDELSAARLELGSVMERADEQLLSGVVATAARNLLARTAAERRRTHQPGLVARASELLASVASDWEQLMVDADSTGKKAEVTVADVDGVELASTRLSTGARALMNLALRLATAELDAERRRVRFPIICDDPLVHLDDERAKAVMPLLAKAAHDGHQVIVFTCHRRTVEAGLLAGGRVVELG
jgi:uncharacterized protein YhaN